MFYCLIKSNWQDAETKVFDKIKPYGSKSNFAILYNNDPLVVSVYIATTDKRLIDAIKLSFRFEIIESIDYVKDLMGSSNGKWGVIGNPGLVNF